MYSITVNILSFFVYSFLGWIFEIICVSVSEKKFVDRGFLIGPYCPIYGFGSMAMVLLLEKYQDDIVALFVMSVVICSILEYVTSYIMEKIFKARWWDYSHKKFNINGRICLFNSIVFGFFGCIVTLVLNPRIVKLICISPPIVLYIILGVLLCTFILDLICSFNIISGMKDAAYQMKKDNTTEITRKVKEILKKKSIFSKRLVNAFPDFSATIKSKVEELEERKKEIKLEIQNEIKRRKK
ncbi:MAG: putative ABC transporter permease [Clostridia bacterium]